MTERQFTEILIATGNAGKLREILSFLRELPIEPLSLEDIPSLVPADETGKTFSENAIIKANHFASLTHKLTLAEDSGLEVEAMHGAPGVLSARYAGPEASDEARNTGIVTRLKTASDIERRAQFTCVLALAEPTCGHVLTFTGICRGSISYEPRGSNGFGYDAIFIPEGYQNTFGELSAAVKAEVSHRARAFAHLKEHLSACLKQPA